MFVPADCCLCPQPAPWRRGFCAFVQFDRESERALHPFGRVLFGTTKRALDGSSGAGLLLDWSCGRLLVMQTPDSGVGAAHACKALCVGAAGVQLA